MKALLTEIPFLDNVDLNELYFLIQVKSRFSCYNTVTYEVLQVNKVIFPFPDITAFNFR